MDDTTDADYGNAKRVYEYFKLKNLGDYHDSYVQSNTLLLADDVSEYMSLILLIFFLHQD